MLRLKCPNQESLLELLSVPDELSFLRKFDLKTHLLICTHCQAGVKSLRAACEAYFKPAPEITSSLLRVYSQLQKDETLILKGWKLGNLRASRPMRERLLREGWIFRGGIAFSMVALILTLLFSQRSSQVPTTVTRNEPEKFSQHLPVAQIRIEERNRVKVRYVQPVLLESMEFETTR